MAVSLSIDDIISSLQELGLKPGDVVNVHSRLYTIGQLDGITADEIASSYRDAIQTVIGKDGTIVVPTYTTSFGRYGTPFILEESPSEFGIFSEHIRQTSGSVRSLHPIQSLSALGKYAQALAGEHPPWNVGYDTIWDRMLNLNAKVISLGIPLKKCLSLVHHIEFIACVPYLYHKILKGNVFAGGTRISNDFFMPVRYLDYGIAYDLSRLETALFDQGAITSTKLGRNQVQAVAMTAVLEVLIKGLRQDPYFLLESVPTFVEGDIPLDGTTIQREGSAPNYFSTG